MPSTKDRARARRRELWRLATTQDSLFTAAQASELGIEHTALRRAVDAGDVERLATGLYSVAGVPDSWRRRARAALLLTGPDAVLSHRTSAGLSELRGFARRTIEVTIQRGRRRRTRSRAGFTVHESTDLRPIDLTTTDGFPATNIVRTFIDLGAVTRELAVEEAYDDAVRRKLVDPTAVAMRYRELSRRGRRGCGPIGRILERRDPNMSRANTFEKLLLRIAREAGLPEPVAQLRVDGPTWTYYLDFGWPDAKLAVECDSLDWHTGLRALQHDDERQNRLVLAGWTVLRFTWQDLHDRPGRVAAQLRAALG